MADEIDTGRIRRRMRDLEQGDRDRSVAERISETCGLSRPGEPVSARFLAALNREIRRAERIADAQDDGAGGPRAGTAIAFAQGAGFACAVRDLLDAAEGRADGTDPILDAPPEVREFLEGLDGRTLDWIRSQAR